MSAIASMQTVSLALPEDVATGPVDMTYLSTTIRSERPPMILVHGFDISSLEYRRLLPLLEEAGIEAYAPCIPGWGFTATTNMKTVGVAGKRAALLAFHERVLDGRPAMWVGASLGACISLDCYKAKPAAFASAAFLAPGFFTDAPPAVPAFVGRLLLQNVLSSPGVRESIAKQAYSVKEDQTDDAIRCGNLHLNRPEWEKDSLEWLLGGAYGGIADDVPSLAALPTLTLWGRKDEVGKRTHTGVTCMLTLRHDQRRSGGCHRLITRVSACHLTHRSSAPSAHPRPSQVIPPGNTVPRLAAALPDAPFRWVEASGHTPHLEQPAVTAAALAAFARGEAIGGDSDVSKEVATYERVQAIKDQAAKAVSAVLGKGAEVASAALDSARKAVDKASTR